MVRGITEIPGDLLQSPVSLAHCVSRDFHMGKGVAKGFRERFGGVAELREQRKGVGDVAVVQRDGRFIFYLITKERYFEKPRGYASVRRCLCRLARYCMSHGLTELAIPRLGCGFGRSEVGFGETSHREDLFGFRNSNYCVS